MSAMKFSKSESSLFSISCWRVSVKAAALSLGFTCVAASASASKSETVTFERAGSGAAAELVDHGDYYVRPDGQMVKFFRKKDIYVVRKKASATAGFAKAKRNAKISINSMQRFKNQFGERVESVSRHQLGSKQVIRINNRQSVKAKSKQAFDIKPSMLIALDASIEGLMPVFTTERGGADLLLLPRITIEMKALENQAQELDRLQSKYGLSVVRKLRLSGDIYSLAYKDASLPANVMFSRSRQLMSESSVEWAEPQFFVKPVKQQAVPNDPMFGQQWNLENRSYRGSRCDTDCDATDAWSFASSGGTLTGGSVVIAVIDDGVQRNHPDLMANMWVNIAERDGTPNVDDDMNGYIDDVHGYDFVTDDSTEVCVNGQMYSDGDAQPLDVGGMPVGPAGQDTNPNPRATANCILPGELDDENPSEDNHGTAVAGILAAVGNNSEGIAGVAYDAQIMPIRAISDFDDESLTVEDEPFCDVIAEAIEYAAQHADVINNSWSLPIICTALETALTKTTSGTVTAGLGSKRNDDGRNGLGAGSPVIFASGNDASGWVKVTVSVPTAGPHAYEWRLLRSQFPEFFDDLDDLEGGLDDDTVWLDDITWPDQSKESFESSSGLSDFTTAWELNSCNASCSADDAFAKPVWTIESRAEFVRDGVQSAKIQAVVGGDDSFCGNSYLHQIKDGPAGEVSFWVWVSTDTQFESDKFEFLIDGVEKLSYGDLLAFGFVDNQVAYPARTGNRASSPTNVIAVGASNSGDLSDDSSASLIAEERVSYSQYGPTLDLVAPSSNQHLGITTTDRTGSDGYDSSDYTSNFGGTSAAAPVVSGVAAVMLAMTPSLDASQVKQMLRDSADKIGPVGYDMSGRNDFHGFGRVNMQAALRLADGQLLSSITPSCDQVSLDYSPSSDLLLPRYTPQQSSFCPALGPMVPDDSFCFPVVTAIDTAALICL